TIRSPEIRDISFTIKPRELRRLRTGWRDPSSRVSFDFVNGRSLRFDNLAYLHPQTSGGSSSTYGSIAESFGSGAVHWWNASDRLWSREVREVFRAARQISAAPRAYVYVRGVDRGKCRLCS